MSGCCTISRRVQTSTRQQGSGGHDIPWSSWAGVKSTHLIQHSALVDLEASLIKLNLDVILLNIFLVHVLSLGKLFSEKRKVNILINGKLKIGTACILNFNVICLNFKLIS